MVGKPTEERIILHRLHTFCSNLNFSIGSMDEKLISLDTARHLSIFFGTLASCSSSGILRSSLPCNQTKLNKILKWSVWVICKTIRVVVTCHSILPVSASLRFIQFTLNPDKISSALAGILYFKGLRKYFRMLVCKYVFLTWSLSSGWCCWYEVMLVNTIVTKTPVRLTFLNTPGPGSISSCQVENSLKNFIISAQPGDH